MNDTLMAEKATLVNQGTFIEYIKHFLPVFLGATNQIQAGRTAELVFEAELGGDPAFARDNFINARTRAACLIPYESYGQTDRALDVLELVFLRHGQLHHDEDNSQRIAEIGESLSLVKLSDIEKQIIEAHRDFWNG